MSKRTWDTVKGVVVAVLLLCAWVGCCYVECHYTRKDCIVVEIAGYTVTAMDRQGHEWCYVVEGSVPQLGTKVDLHMYTNHTDSYIYDDEVVGVSTHNQ